jgi:heat shock protein HslJ/outer membrane murein-binding lipoprotein Lpp
MKTLIVIVVAAAWLVLAGCGNQTPEEATAQFCTSLQEFDAAVQQLEQITPENTVGEAQQARDGVSDAWEQVTRSAENLAEVRVDSIEDAWKSLEQTINSISNRDTIADAAAEVIASAAQVRAAVADVGSVSCPDLNLGSAAAQPAAGEAVDTAPAELAPAADTGVTGSYMGQMPPTNGSQEAMTLTLHPNGEASLVFSPANASEGAEQAAAERILVGTWIENADQTVSVALDRLQDGKELAIAETFVFQRQDGQLVALEYNKEVYGPSGFSMQASVQAAAVPAGSDVISATASTGVTTTVGSAITNTTGVAPAETGAAQPAELVGTVWQLQQIQQGAAVTSVPDPTLYTLTLSGDGAAAATAACSLGSGVYQADGSSISFQLGWSAASCAQTSLDRQFATYLDYANAYALEQGSLVIYFNNSSGQMIFAPGQ